MAVAKSPAQTSSPCSELRPWLNFYSNFVGEKEEMTKAKVAGVCTPWQNHSDEEVSGSGIGTGVGGGSVACE